MRKIRCGLLYRLAVCMALPVMASFPLAAQASPDSFSFSLGAAGYAGAFDDKPGLLSDELRAVLDYANGPFGLLVDLSFLNDGKYPSHNVFEMGHYFQPNESVMRIAGGGLSFTGGRGPHRDELSGPYALFISGNDIPALYLDLAWESPVFKYESRWVSLNYESNINYEGTSLDFIDRGLNYKVYAMNLGAFRFGYQDASVYVGRPFDPESFISPLPAYVQQMVLASSGRPYSQGANPNSLMGLFAEWKGYGFLAAGQFLLDDINASFLSPLLGWAIPALKDIDNVQKIAWSLGGDWESPIGTVSFHHAGATKYCFESTYTSATSNTDFGLDAPDYDSLPYPYAYYPATTYARGTREYLIDPEENYIGYRHGENNLAFMASWKGSPWRDRAWGFDAEADLEYVVSGSKSPANPWHELDTWRNIGKAFVMFDESVLEHSLILSARAEKEYRAWTFNAAVQLGWIWNPLIPAAVPRRPEEAKIWKPSAGQSEAVCGISIGASYKFGWGGE